MAASALTRIVSVEDLDDSIDEIARIIANSEHTRLPVYRDDIDHVIDILHLRKLANLAETRLSKTTLRRL